MRDGGGFELANLKLLMAGVRSLREGVKSFLGRGGHFFRVTRVFSGGVFGCGEVCLLFESRVAQVQEGNGLAEEE